MHIPRRIGRYDILDRIGYGGMGMVFRGRDPHIGRSVAIKLLRISDEDLHDRFLREAQSAGGLKHPNIVTIYDFGEHEGAPFIVMEYVEGTTLAEHIKQNIPLTLARKLELLEELAAGLEYAHKKGVVHRDVKPANVMVDREGILRILDFGIARVTDSGLTQTGMIMGTPNYMSPEQVEGKASDRRSDIFAAGLVMYELLSYHQAFPGDTMHQVMDAIVRQAPVPLRTLVPDLDPALETIVNRAIEKDPARRYQTMAAMGTHIARLRSKLEPGTSAFDEGTVISGHSAPLPPRTDRHVLEQRRAERIQTLLRTAEQALDSGRFVEALDACEQVVLISPEDAKAAALMERARNALDQQQVEQLIAEARTCIDEGHLAEGAELARRALGIQPDHAPASALLEEISAIERGERERVVKERAIALAIDKCRDAALAGDAEGVVAAAEEVLALDSGHAEARDLMAEARSLIEARERERDAERRAREVVDRARREFHDGHHEDSIARLERYTPSHPIVSRAIDELRAERAEFERLKREAERQRQRDAEEAAAERQLQIAVGLSRAAIALAEQRFPDAAAAVDAVLALDPEHPRALGLQGDIAAAIEARQRQEEAERRADEAIKSAEALFDAGDPVAAMDLLNNHPGDLPRVAAALARLQQRYRTTSEREVEARRAEHDRRAAEAIASAQVRIDAGEHREALEALEHFTPSHPDVDRVLRDLRREIERRHEAQWVAEQTAAAAAEIDAGRFEDALTRLNRLPQTGRDQGNVPALLARAEAGASAASEAQRERHTAATQLADAEAAANGWEPARTLAILETLEKRMKARVDLQDLAPRIEQLSALARRRQDLLGLMRESSAQLRSGALQGALATVDRALAEEPQLPGAAELRGRIEAAIAAEGQERARGEAAQSAVAAARKLALDGRLDDGIKLLEQADTGHAAVAGALTDLRRERADLQRREREQREQDEKRVQARRAEIAALLKRARKAKSPDAAIALLRSALELDPENADAQEALGKYQEQRQDRSAGRAAGATASRSKTLWRLGGLASAIVALIVVGYVISQRPPEPANPPVTVTAPTTVTPPTTVAAAPPTTTVPAAPPLAPSTVPPTTIPARGQRPGQNASQTGRGRNTATQLPPSTQSVPPPQLPPSTVPAPPTTVPATTTTTTTTVPATTSVAPVVSISESAAQQVIMTYYAAFKARDFNALRAIFPTASENDRARIEALRKDYEPCDYELRGLEVNSLTATRAFVRVHVTETCRPRIRTSPRQIEGSKAFELGKTSDGRWVVTTGG
jgi:eukaryotic-like serine/threonine-protein kinase